MSSKKDDLVSGEPEYEYQQRNTELLAALSDWRIVKEFLDGEVLPGYINARFVWRLSDEKSIDKILHSIGLYLSLNLIG